MTKRTIRSYSNKIILSTSAMLMLLFLFSCAKKTTAVNKTEVPSPAEAPSATVVPIENKGQVQIKRDATGNYVVQINLRELEEVNKLEATSKKAYIVWMNADNDMTKNLGQINSNSGWLSDKSKAYFEATTAAKPTKIFITEEDMADVKKPGKKIIWSTNSF